MATISSNHPEATRPHGSQLDGVRDLIGRIDLRIVGEGLGVAVVVIAVITSVVALAVSGLADSPANANNLPSFATSVGAFIGFLVAGMFVARHAAHDRFAHVFGLIAAGFLLALVVTIVDQAAGDPIEQLMPGRNGIDAATVHLGFWVVNWVVLPAGAVLGGALVPRRGEGWGRYDHEPEDTEV